MCYTIYLRIEAYTWKKNLHYGKGSCRDINTLAHIYVNGGDFIDKSQRAGSVCSP